MKLETIFAFLFIVVSLVIGLFVLQTLLETLFLTGQKEISLENPQFKDLTEKAKSQYLALKEFFEAVKSGTDKNQLAVPSLSTFFLDKILSPEQRIGQLFIIGIEGTEVGLATEELIKNFYPGGILLLKKNIENPEQLKKLISDLQDLSIETTGLPLFVAVDQEGGLIDRVGFLQEKTAQSEMTSQEHARLVGLERSKELKELGVNVNLAPLLDETRPGDFIFQRGFQKEPAIIGDLALGLISGQREAGILTAVKHFPGYTGIRFNPEERLAILSEIPEISQFQKVISAEPEFVMTANVIYQALDPNLPFSFSSTSVQFLKDNLGEKPLLISDDLAQNSLLKQFSLEQIVTLPFLSGLDVLLFSGWRAPVEPAISAFREAVKTDIISEQEIDQRVIKIIQLKSELSSQP